MADAVRVSVTVNGQPQTAEVEPRLLLVHFLRDTLGLTGTHVGCDTSNCGACTVHLDGVSVKSCTILAAQADGASVRTIEGMADGADLHPLQEGFWAEHGLQCGYCTPGMIMAAADLLERNPDPSEHEIREGLAGNLCRCTGYHNIVKAVQHAAELQRAATAPEPGREAAPGPGHAGGVGMSEANGGLHVGRAMRRKEDPPLIAGQGQLRRRHHAAGHALGGVRALARGARHDQLDRHVGRARAATASRPSTPAPTSTSRRRSRWPGSRPAWTSPRRRTGRWPRTPSSTSATRSRSSSARDRYAVVDAAEDVIVDYDPLPVVVDPEKALAGGDLVHPDLGSNKVHEWSLGGDVEAALEGADVVIEHRFVNHRTAGAPIETRGVIADYRAGELTMWSATQVPHFLRLFLALQLGMTEDRVRAIAPDVGGGFGSKLQIYGEEILLAWVSRKLGLPVKWVETRSENMATAHHGRDQIAYVTMGADRDGTFKGLHVKIVADLGAYMMLLTPMIPSLGAFVMAGCYKWDAVRTDITGVMTNKMATDAIRGAGRPEATHYIEVMVDQMAQELGIDRLELRRRNFIPPEDFPAETAAGWSTTRATTRARSRGCSSTSTRPRRRARRRTASCAASGSRPGRRSAGWRRRAPRARAASASRRG